MSKTIRKVQISLLFWRPPQDIRTPAARYCPARRNNLPRAGQISNMPSRSLLHAVLIPVTTGLFPLYPLGILFLCTGNKNKKPNKFGFSLSYSYLSPLVKVGGISEIKTKNSVFCFVFRSICTTFAQYFAQLWVNIVY